MNKVTKPTLADVIVKVTAREKLSAEEELVYLEYIKGLPEPDRNQLMREWFLKYRVG